MAITKLAPVLIVIVFFPIMSLNIASLKGTATSMITIFYLKDLNKPWILISVSSKSVEKRRSCGRLNICKWTVHGSGHIVGLVTSHSLIKYALSK